MGGFVDRRAAFSYLTAMAIRDILILPDPALRKVAKPLADIDDGVRALMDDMLETMYAAPGIGLAAPQIGIDKRLIVLDVSKTEEEDEKEPMVFVNPDIVWTSDETALYEEGCLSIPDYYEEVERPAACRVRYLDRGGDEREIDCESLLATCIQHEIDHLNGVLFIDHLSKLKRDRITKKFTKARKRAAA